MSEDNEKRLFHYTTGLALAEILKDGKINVATENVTAKEKPVVWCSFRQDWEPSTMKGVTDAKTGKVRNATIPEIAFMGRGLARIEINASAAPYPWHIYIMQAGTPKRILKGLYNTAVAVGARVEDWRVSFEPIKEKDWLVVECSADGKE